MSNTENHAVRDVSVPNREGLHARPVMRFVEVASRFQASVSVTNITRNQETVDGKSPMQMMLLEATQNNVLRIEAKGADAVALVEALSALVASGFDPEKVKNP